MTRDLTVCPGCGKRGFRLASEETLYGTASITLGITAAGALTATWDGDTEVDYTTSTTTVYLCLDCGRVLPTWYAEALDTLLQVSRAPERWSQTYQPMEEGD